MGGQSVEFWEIGCGVGGGVQYFPGNLECGVEIYRAVRLITSKYHYFVIGSVRCSQSREIKNRHEEYPCLGGA